MTLDFHFQCEYISAQYDYGPLGMFSSNVGHVLSALSFFAHCFFESSEFREVISTFQFFFFKVTFFNSKNE